MTIKEEMTTPVAPVGAGAEQSKDKSNFIDASSVWLPDMGEVEDLKD